MCSYTTFEIKVDLCAHTDSKNGIFTRRVYSAYILTRTPSPFSAGSSWGLLSRKIFFDFIFLFLLFDFYSYFIFFIFLIFVWILVSTLFFRLSYLIISTRLKFVILYFILFFRLSVVLTRIQVLLDIYSITIPDFASDFPLASISTCFSIVYSML